MPSYHPLSDGRMLGAIIVLGTSNRTSMFSGDEAFPITAALDRERQLLALERLRGADRNLPARATVAALVVATGLARNQ